MEFNSNASDTTITVSASQTNISDITASSPASSSASKEHPNRPPTFVPPNYEPTQAATDFVKFDFCHGARVVNLKGNKPVHCLLIDNDSDNVLFAGKLDEGSFISCAKKYRINYKIVISDLETQKTIYEHCFCMKDRDVFVQMPYEGAVGDSISWFSPLERFQQQEQCRLHVLMPPKMRALFEKQYPDIHFVTLEEARELRPYAAFYLGLYFKGDENNQPYDFRLMSLTDPISRILGVKDMSEIPPRVDLSAPRRIPDRYVVIASQASSHAKHWCNPSGWRVLVQWLKIKGYRVLCIDKDREVGEGDVWHHIPYGSEDFTGPRPLQERIDLIHHADFFIGLSSGLSWLAWCCKVPIVLISGICMPFGEFQTPYRVQTRITCHGCWNDTRYDFDHHDFMWCPKHKGTPRAYECTKAITPRMVIDVIRQIPGTLCTSDTFDDAEYQEALG